MGLPLWGPSPWRAWSVVNGPVIDCCRDCAAAAHAQQSLPVVAAAARVWPIILNTDRYRRRPLSLLFNFHRSVRNGGEMRMRLVTLWSDARQLTSGNALITDDNGGLVIIGAIAGWSQWQSEMSFRRVRVAVKNWRQTRLNWLVACYVPSLVINCQLHISVSHCLPGDSCFK